MSKIFKISNFLGPFLAIVISMLCILAGILGVFVFFTVSPQWAWAIVIAALISGYLIDRLMYFGIKKMNERAQTKLSEMINKRLAEMRANIPKGGPVSKPPDIPNTQEPLN